MAAEGPKSVAFFLFILNLILYAIVMAIAGWAIETGIEETFESASKVSIPARIFPIYFPTGNFATGFLAIFSLVAGAVGVGNSIAGIYNVIQWNKPNILSAATYSIPTWALTVLAMGLAWKEIQLGGRNATLKTLEALTIILSGTQFFCMAALNVGVSEVFNKQPHLIGRV